MISSFVSETNISAFSNTASLSKSVCCKAVQSKHRIVGEGMLDSIGMLLANEFVHIQSSERPLASSGK